MTVCVHHMMSTERNLVIAWRSYLSTPTAYPFPCSASESELSEDEDEEDEEEEDDDEEEELELLLLLAFLLASACFPFTALSLLTVCSDG